jgi:hypothetical protein
MPKWRTEQEDAEGPCQIRFVPGLRVPRPRTIRCEVLLSGGILGDDDDPTGWGSKIR